MRVRSSAFFWVMLLFLGATMASTAAAYLTPVLQPAGYAEPWLVTNRFGYPSVLNTLYGAGNYVRVDDSWDQIWWEYDGTATAEAKFAGDSHKIGFEQGSGGGPKTNWTVADGTWTSTSGSGYGVSGSLTFDFDPNDYLRFYIKDVTTGAVWSSKESENTDAIASIDHMVSYYITGGASAGHYALAFEDRSVAGGSDRDFQDMVIEVSMVNPVPEPGSLALLGLVILGAGAGIVRRRRR